VCGPSRPVVEQVGCAAGRDDASRWGIERLGFAEWGKMQPSQVAWRWQLLDLESEVRDGGGF